MPFCSTVGQSSWGRGGGWGAAGQMTPWLPEQGCHPFSESTQQSLFTVNASEALACAVVLLEHCGGDCGCL